MTKTTASSAEKPAAKKTAAAKTAPKTTAKAAVVDESAAAVKTPRKASAKTVEKTAAKAAVAKTPAVKSAAKASAAVVKTAAVKSKFTPPPAPDLPTLTKAELADAVSGGTRLGRREAADLVDTFFALLTRTLARGEEVKLPGLGNFGVRQKAQRPGRNPRTGESVPITARRVVTFHPSAKLRLAMLD